MARRAKQYKRSSVGCWTCRRRKIKCDAIRPHCQRCGKSNLQCEGYGIKLNWSSPLIIQDKEMKYLNGNPDLESFQRSNIELCKWAVYRYYNEMDDDLNAVDRTLKKKGPFGVFRYKEISSVGDAPLFINFRVKSILQFQKSDLFNYVQLINTFLSSIGSLFHEDDKRLVQTMVQNSVGSLVLGGNDLDLCITLSVITVALLQLTKQDDSQGIERVYQFKSKIDSLIEQASQLIPNFPNASLLLILVISINTKLGIYKKELFQFTTDDTLSHYYEFHKSTNTLLNHSASFHPKFHKIYKDVLDPNYNLLKNFDQNSSNPSSGKITISNKKTPLDQIIRVPRYIDDEADGEAVPPSFMIHFQNGDADPDDERDESGQLNDDYTAVYDSVSDLSGLSTAFGVHRMLISLYMECCELINQSRIFGDQYSRNFPKICTELEELLVRSVPKEIKFSPRDEVFYDFLLYLFYKFVKNYPQKMLNYHWKRIKSENLGIGVIKFITRDTSESDTIWGSSFVMREWLKNNELIGDDRYDDWSNDYEIYVV